jgi:CheY-like chemotaxis protein
MLPFLLLTDTTRSPRAPRILRTSAQFLSALLSSPGAGQWDDFEASNFCKAKAKCRTAVKSPGDHANLVKQELMKRNIILLVDPDANTCAATLDAARTGGFEVRFAQIQRDLSELTEFGLDDIAAIVLDYDPDVHGSATSEMLVQWLPPRPLVFISSNEGPWHPPMLAGAPVKHLTKPVTAARLAHAIETLAAGTCHAESPCCDRWGHLCSSLCHSNAHADRNELVSKARQKTYAGNF